MGNFRHEWRELTPDGCFPSALQEILEEVRKELQKVKEEIIGGEVMFLFFTQADLVCSVVCVCVLTASALL